MINPKELPPKERMRYITEVMRMRERGRAELLRASQRRRHKAMKKSSEDWHTHLGMVDDAEYGAFMSISSVPAFKEQLKAYVQ